MASFFGPYRGASEPAVPPGYLAAATEPGRNLAAGIAGAGQSIGAGLAAMGQRKQLLEDQAKEESKKARASRTFLSAYFPEQSDRFQTMGLAELEGTMQTIAANQVRAQEQRQVEELALRKRQVEQSVLADRARVEQIGAERGLAERQERQDTGFYRALSERGAAAYGPNQPADLAAMGALGDYPGVSPNVGAGAMRLLDQGGLAGQARNVEPFGPPIPMKDENGKLIGHMVITGGGKRQFVPLTPDWGQDGMPGMVHTLHDEEGNPVAQVLRNQSGSFTVVGRPEREKPPDVRERLAIKEDIKKAREAVKDAIIGKDQAAQREAEADLRELEEMLRGPAARREVHRETPGARVPRVGMGDVKAAQRPNRFVGNPEAEAIRARLAAGEIDYAEAERQLQALNLE